MFLSGKERNWIKFILSGILGNLKKVIEKGEPYLKDEEFLVLGEIYGQIVKILKKWEEKR